MTKTIKVIVYVNDVEVAQAQRDVPDEQVNKVIGAVGAQVENADEDDSEPPPRRFRWSFAFPDAVVDWTSAKRLW